ncbi:hypothetical protein BG55_19145 [Erwinia mallotivora]|uniref:Uncharacterized protein n=1 Tax=Erwinia mallotivora TaxID=69222 RepID=A0A014LWV7_9GAMM|nr:hypothetical protein BG55_19145 [Erwinia mallotivora]
MDSGGTVSLSSGRDTTLSGAQVSGNRVVAEVGRDLSISSQQDSDKYDSTQSSFGAGGSFTFGTMTGSGYVNASRDRMHSSYDSVQEQSGLYAGNGGFDVTVGNHTQLNGGVIASTADAEKNTLDTGTLGFSDIATKRITKRRTRGSGSAAARRWAASLPVTWQTRCWRARAAGTCGGHDAVGGIGRHDSGARRGQSAAGRGDAESRRGGCERQHQPDL